MPGMHGLSSIHAPRALAAAVALAALLVLGGCGKGDAPGAQGGGPPGAGGKPGGAPPPPEVGVVVATPGNVSLVTELPGRLEASRIAQVSARAAGIVLKRVFREGSDVKAGQVLFRIDSSPYEATLNSVKAQQASAEANLGQAAALARRYKPLVEANAISKQEYANAVAAQKSAQAQVGVARAAVENAQISLGYATVTAPISGRIGRALVTEGALVGQGQATPLATIQQLDPLFVNFTQSATELLRLQRAMAGSKMTKVNGKDAAEVRIVLEDGSDYALPGKLLFSEVTVEPSTGQVTLRAEVPNPKRELLPGMYVRVKIEQSQADNAITVPQQAVTRTEQGDSVTVVGDDGKTSKRSVKIDAASNNRWVVRDGLKAGDKVMVDGFQKLQMMPPGTPVKPVPWQSPAEKAKAGDQAKPGDPAKSGDAAQAGSGSGPAAPMAPGKDGAPSSPGASEPGKPAPGASEPGKPAPAAPAKS